MANVFVEESSLQDIADAIRSKNGTQDTYKPSEMAEAIEDIGGGITPSGTKSITENGTYDITAFASANVNVPNSYGAEDIGKVVSPNRQLVSQGSAQYTENGTYDTTLVGQVEVNVQGSGGLTWNDIASWAQPSGEVNITGTRIENYAFAYRQKANQPWQINAPLVTYLGQNAFRECTYLTEARFPRLESQHATGYVFYGCSRLALLDWGLNELKGNTFTNCSALKTLILRKTTAIQPIQNTSVFNGTPFKSGGSGGTIYIPEVLYNHLGDGSALDYKSATNWSTYDGYGTITWAKLEGSEYE